MSVVKFDKLPSVSFTSPDFLKFSKIPDMVWIDFLMSEIKFNYTGKFKIKYSKMPLNYIGEIAGFKKPARVNYIHT